MDSGSARLIFDNGTLVRLSGPAKVEIVDEWRIQLHHGDLLVEVPKKNNQFCCLISQHEFGNPNNATYFVSANEDKSWESMVIRGSLDVSDLAGSQSNWHLAKNMMSQALFEPLDTLEDNPKILMAKGNGNFRACCYSNTGSLMLDSPEKLQFLLTSVIEDNDVAWHSFANNLDDLKADSGMPGTQVSFQQFQKLLGQHLQKHFPQDKVKNESDTTSGSTTQFQGSLNINGEVQHFDSREEFDRASRRLLQGSFHDPVRQGEFNHRIGSTELPSIRVLGQEIQFSSPDRFKQIKRNMNQ